MKHYLTVLLVMCVLMANAGTDSLKVKVLPQYVFKVYPLAFGLSQIPSYCSELRFGLEMPVVKRHSIEPGISVFIPSLFAAMGRNMYGGDGYAVFGGKAMVSYRYYCFKDKGINLNGMYVGGEVSFTGLGTGKRNERVYTSGFTYDSYGEHYMRGIMTNYNFMLGYQKIVNKGRRNGKTKHVAIQIGVSAGYRYHYFWRKYPKGNLEYLYDKENITKDLYSWYKGFPVGGSINFSVGKWW